MKNEKKLKISGKGKESSHENILKNRLYLEEKWFVKISSTYFGINQRAKKLLNTLYRDSINVKHLNEQLREIALNDIWFYTTCPNADRALRIIINFFRKVVFINSDCYNKERIVATLVEFLCLLHQKQIEKDLFLKIFNHSLQLIEEVMNNDEYIFLQSSHLLKTFPIDLTKNDAISKKLNFLLKKSLKKNLAFWKENLHYREWYEEERKNYHSNFVDCISDYEKEMIEKTEIELQKENISWHDLKKIYDYKNYMRKLNDQIKETDQNIEIVYYIFYLLHLPVPAYLKDFLILDLNRALKDITILEIYSQFEIFLAKIFSIFEKLKEKHMEKILDCILAFGKKIYQMKDQSRIDQFINQLIQFGFVNPDVSGIDQDWQILTDRNHIKNIRIWLKLVECSPRASRKLIAALIVNLKVGGIFIRDNDLFQRDISRLLNSNFESCYNLIKQLTYLFPVYYKNIGAEGKIRDITTAIDKQSFREDKLIHFLRKQIHTESNNTQIEFIRRIFFYWYDGNIRPLLKYLPSDVKQGLLAKNKWFNPTHRAIRYLCSKMNVSIGMILETDLEKIRSNIREIKEIDQFTGDRIVSIIELYCLLKHKYSLDSQNIINDLKQTSYVSIKEVDNLARRLKEKKYAISIKQVFVLISRFKEIVLSKKESKSHEDIYYKRHIAAGIPSMYGQYSEKKFESLGLIFRLERLADVLINQFINQRNLAYMTIDGFHNAAKILELFKEGLRLNGISSENFNSNLEMLHYSFKTSTFSMDQFVNIFYFLTLNIKEIIENYYMNPFNPSLKHIIPQFIKKQRRIDDLKINFNHIVYKKSEEFFRNGISAAFLVQHLDNYLSRILVTLREMTEKLEPKVISMLLKYDPKLLFSSFYESTSKVNNQTFLGAKAYYLKKLYSYKFPVPPGFVLTTEWFRERKAISKFPEMYQAMLRLIEEKVEEIERISCKKFGDLKNPLLLAVRSGTVISMPGAMDSLLNIGMNDKIAENLSKLPGYGWAAWDSYRRLLQNWGMAHGISRDDFDKIIIYFKKLYQVQEKKTFSNLQMKKIALAYKELLNNRGVELEEDPFKQLIQAIIFVFQSWYNQRANIYRKKLQIAEEWGTAVIVQEMVFGNINSDSGSGVVFTKVPFEKSSEVVLYGDFSRRSQGEDIVSGLVHTLPVSEFQHKKTPHLKGKSLEKQFPQIYQELYRLAKELVYKKGYEHQEIEFTFKSKNKKDLYILQTRNYILEDKEAIPVFSDVDVYKHLIGTGIGIGRGAMNGIVAFNMDDLKYLAKKYPDKNKILIRPDTVPDDIAMIFECDGLLTSRGGVTSHAAVTAAQLGKTCVVNCRQLIVLENEKKGLLNEVEIKTGDEIAIDAHMGNIYKGNYAISSEKINII